MVIAIANQKGGVSKTTTVINVGGVLAKFHNKKVLLVDMDPQANCSSGVGIRLGLDEPGIQDILVDPEETDIRSIICETAISNLFVAPSHINLADKEADIASQTGGDRSLSVALRSIIHEYDYIIVDSPPNLGIFVLNAILAADSLIIPTTAETFALDGMGALARLLRRIKARLEKEIFVMGVVITNYQKTTRIHSALNEVLQEHWGNSIFETVIRKNIDVSEAVAHSLPVVVRNENCNASKDYIALTEEILQREQERISGISTP